MLTRIMLCMKLEIESIAILMVDRDLLFKEFLVKIKNLQAIQTSGNNGL